MVSASRAQFDRLAARRLFSLLIAGTDGDDGLSISVIGSDLFATVNGASTTYDLSGVDSVEIVSGDGADTIDLLATGAIPVRVDGGPGADRFWVGSGDWHANVSANVTLRGGSGADLAVIDDSLSPASVVSVNNPFNIDTQFSRQDGGTIFVDAGTPDSAIEQIDYLAGGEADQISVLGLSSFTSLRILAGAGADTLYVADDFDSKINGALTLIGGAGANALEFDDSADAFGDAYLFAGAGSLATIGKDSTATLLTYSDFATLHVTAGLTGSFPNNQFFRVSYLPAAIELTIDAGTGDDALTVGTAAIDLESIQAQITFNGENGFDRVDVFDLLGTDPALYTVMPQTLSISGQLPIVFSDIQFLHVRANAASNQLDVLATVAPLSVTLDGGGGDDTFHIGAGDIDSTIGNSVSVVGGAGNDRLVLDDSIDDAGNDTYIVNAGVINRSIKNVLWSTAAANATEVVELLGSENADNVRVSSASPTVTLRIDTAGGDDTIAIERTNDSVGSATPVVIASGDGQDSLIVNSDNTGSDAIVLIESTVESLAQLTIRAGGRLNMAAGGDRILKLEGALNNEGVLDLNDQTLIVASGEFASIDQLVGAGYNGGTWTAATPAAIVSSVAAQSILTDSLAVVRAETVGLPTYAGVATTAGDVIVRYTLAADANLDRAVNFDDLLILAQSYNPEVGGRTWVQGNFNYATEDHVAGAVGFDDLLLLAQNYGLTLAIDKSHFARRKSR